MAVRAFQPVTWPIRPTSEAPPAQESDTGCTTVLELRGPGRARVPNPSGRFPGVASACKPYNIRFVADRNVLGEFEHMLLAAVIRLGEDAYGASILEEIEEQARRRVPSGSLYVTLDRLERKGLIRSHPGEPEPGRGGRPKRFVRITPEGLRAVKEVREAMLSLWAGIESRLEDA